MADDDAITPKCKGQSGLEEWRESIRKICGRYHPEEAEPGLFSGWAELRQRCSFDVLDVGCNVDRIERALVDVRRDQTEYYFLVLQLSGDSTMLQNDRVAKLGTGDGVLIDSTRPSSFRYTRSGSRQMSLHLPRKKLITYLGFEPQGGSKLDSNSPVARMLYDFVNQPDEQCDGSARCAFGHLLIFDLLGALFAPAESPTLPSSVHAEKLFQRVCAQIERHYSNPSLKISDIADETGISVRYIQKLFTQRNESFSHYLERYRLERAAMLLRRRALLPVKISIGEVATSCGFGSLAQFSRSFSEHIGVPPSLFALSAEDDGEELRFVGAQPKVRSQLNR